MKIQHFLLCILILGMSMKGTAQQRSEAASHPAGYQITINAKENNLVLAYKETIAQIREALKTYILPDSSLAPIALQKLTEIEQWIASLQPKVQGLHIDVIGQTHIGGATTDQMYQNELLTSQSMIRDILFANNYDLIGNEGDVDKIVTKESILKADTVRTSVGMQVVSQESKMLFYGAYGQTRMAVHALLLSGFKGPVMGIEDSVMNRLHGMVLYNPYCRPLSDLMTTLRSDIAFFKIAEVMLARKLQKTAIVIGAAHLRDFVWLARSSGTITDFYSTSFGDGLKIISDGVYGGM